MPMLSPFPVMLTVQCFSVSRASHYVPPCPKKPLSSLLPCGNVSECLMKNVIGLRFNFLSTSFSGLLSDIKTTFSVLSVPTFNCIKLKFRSITLSTHPCMCTSVHTGGSYSSFL